MSCLHFPIVSLFFGRYILLYMALQDTSISRLTREIEQLKKDVRNRDVQIATLTAKMSRIKQSAQDGSEETARDKELIGLRLVSSNL